VSEHTFRLWFSGLVHFVENKDPNAKCQLCVVLPRGDNSTAHRTHVAAIYKADREIRCGQPRLKRGDRIIALTPHPRRRVSFEIRRFDDLPPQDGLALSFSSFGALNMRDIAGIFADENDQIVDVYPPADAVLAQILIGKGYNIGVDPSLSILREWRIPETLTGFPEFRLLLADPMYVDIPHVRSVKMHYAPIDPEETVNKAEPPEPPSPVELRPGSNGMIEIFVANRCEGDYCLREEDFEWRREGNRWILMQLDRDFELNYNMLHPTTLDVLRRLLSQDGSAKSGEVRFPVPESPFLEFALAPHLCFELQEQERKSISSVMELVTKKSLDAFSLQDLLDFIARGTGGGSGSDCLGGVGEARFNALDNFIPDPELPPDRLLVQAKHQKMSARSVAQASPTNRLSAQEESSPPAERSLDQGSK